MARESAIVYARYSPRPEDTCESLDFQADFCKRYFDFHGIKVDRVIGDPDTSARLIPLIKRQGGRELIKLTTGYKPEYTIVGAYRLDRLWRDVVDGNITLKLWQNHKVVCHFAAEGGCSVNTTTATGRFLVNMLLAKAAYEPDLTSERTSAAMQRHMANGWSMGGTPPYGKCHGPKKKAPNGVWRITLIDEPTEQNIIAQIEGWREEGWTLRKIARYLNELNLPSRSGEEWTHVTVKRILSRRLQAGPSSAASIFSD